MTGAREQGFLMVAAILLLVVLSFFALVITDLYVVDTKNQSAHLQSSQALFVAESGVSAAARGLLSPTVLTPSSTDNREACAAIATPLTQVAVGDGAYSVTAVTPAVTTTYAGGYYGGDAGHPAVTLNGALSATATTIPLAVGSGSLADYAPAGRVDLDGEAIDYAAIGTTAAVCGTAPCLLGVKRGADGTQATTHASGTVVSQAQCTIHSAGAVPNAVNANANRTLTTGVTVQDTWMAGAEGLAYANGTPTANLLHWTGVPPGGAATPPANLTLNGITCLSPSDCWAVGSADVLRVILGGKPKGVATVMHWDGSTWTDFSGTLPAAVANDDLDAVTCVSHDDCWMVGALTRGHWVVLHMAWNGTNTAPVWTSYPPPLGYTLLDDVDGVACVSANQCYVVGSFHRGLARLALWNGTGQWVAVQPTPVFLNRDLDAITCSATDCFAVGAGSQGVAAIIHWSAATGTWTDQSAEVAGSADVENVGCASASLCFATGSWNQNSPTTLLRWDGSTWSDVSATVPASVSATQEDLEGVACAASNDCWIVGSVWGATLGTGVGGQGFVAIHWNGTAWVDDSSAFGAVPDAEGVALTGPGARPASAWGEVFP